ncbi:MULTISPECIES: WD40 repeat domain-containing protein [Gammaproteobacteria]|uniref:WD40 repeat domain-containing protein n=1 Tax=Gammaproteobacteria TaxID=1236 RepID=UPI000DD0680E|nr:MULTISPECIES: hypothetical protein [Gammaproteobacteria]RTE85711.1 hypothetical protein DQX04_09665 [Aliidiomarina sp. B3213]TCZ90289.1 hypothetical protein EYQ95_10795 [Lysobacter sp. N42]
MRFMLLSPKSTLVILLCCIFTISCAEQADLLSQTQRTQGRVQTAAISYDGRYSLIASTEQGLRMFDNEQDELVHNWQQEDEGISQIIAVSFSQDSEIAIAASRMTLALWDTQTGNVIGAWRNDESIIHDIAISNQGEHIVFGRNDNVVILFEPNTGRRLEFFGHTDRVNQVSISPNGQYVLSGGNDHKALLWSTNTGQVIHEIPTDGRVLRIALDMEGRFGLVSTATETRIIHLVSGEIISTLQTNVRQKVFSTARFSYDGSLLITGTASRQVEIWSVESGERLAMWRVDGGSDEQPPRAAVLAAYLIDRNRARVETSAGFGEVWHFELQETP